MDLFLDLNCPIIVILPFVGVAGLIVALTALLKQLRRRGCQKKKRKRRRG